MLLLYKFDFVKAYNTVPHRQLKFKFSQYGNKESLLQ